MAKVLEKQVASANKWKMEKMEGDVDPNSFAAKLKQADEYAASGQHCGATDSIAIILRQMDEPTAGKPVNKDFWHNGAHVSICRDTMYGDTITIEPWRSRAFPVVKDLVVDRSAYDKILQAGGYISVNTGGVPDANAIPIPKKDADESMDAAACIGCGACVATCKNGSAMLFVAARVSSLALLPQGKVEAARRAKAMVAKMDELGFGGCTNTGACEAECPKGISIAHIARLNREFLCAKLKD